MNSSALHHHRATPTLHFTAPSKRHCFTPLFTPFSSSLHRPRRHLRRNLLKKPLPTTNPPPMPITTTSPLTSSSTQEHTLHLHIPLHSQDYLKRLKLYSKLYLNQFIESSQDAIEDIRTLVSFDNGYSYSYDNNYGPRGVVVSCKKSTVQFLGMVLVSSFVIVYAFKVVLKLGKFLIFSLRVKGGGEGSVVYKRDRSLGGKLVAVGSNDGGYRSGLDFGETKRDDGDIWDWSDEVKEWRSERGKTGGVPKWWPKEKVESGIGGMMDEDEKKEYQNVANRFIRAMMDNRLRGKDITEDDIIQLRRMCKTYGLKVSIDTANSRDSLYRTSVNFVLDYCEKQANESAQVQIDYEDVQQFVAGLADNIGLDDTRAVKMVSAAVAARTRSRFLQAWALEMQGKHSEAVTELQKVCFIHQIFPPEEHSPEMEMVARGLNNHLKEDQRESLMNTLTSACGEKTPRSVIEALGLIR